MLQTPRPAGDVMTEEVLSVSTDTDQEKVAARFSATTSRCARGGLEQRLVGIVTVDDVIDVIERATRISTPPARFGLAMTTTTSAATCSPLPVVALCGWRWCSPAFTRK